MIFNNEIGGINVTFYPHLFFRVPNPQLAASALNIILFLHHWNPEVVPMPLIIFLHLYHSSQVCSRAGCSARILVSSHSSVKLGISVYYLLIISSNVLHSFYYPSTFYDIMYQDSVCSEAYKINTRKSYDRNSEHPWGTISKQSGTPRKDVKLVSLSKSFNFYEYLSIITLWRK